MRLRYTINLNTNTIRVQANNAMMLGLMDAGKEIKAVASVLAPKDTSALSRSGKVTRVGDEVEVSFGAENSESTDFSEPFDDIRAVAQEFGTTKFPAQPYLTPATQLVDIAFFVQKRLKL